MIEDLRQSVALATHGDLFLRTSVQPPELFAEHPVFDYVHELEFHRPGIAVFPRQVFRGTRPWYMYLRDRGAREMTAATWGANWGLPQHIAAAFMGASQCGVQVRYRRSCELWVPRADLRSVVFRRHWRLRPVRIVPFAEADREVQDVLDEVIMFTRMADWRGWHEYYSDALALRRGCTPLEDDSLDLLPETGYSENARLLLACVSKAWAFGGMGSWNDASFGQEYIEDKYNELTPRMFSAFLAAFSSATEAREEPGQR